MIGATPSYYVHSDHGSIALNQFGRVIPEYCSFDCPEDEPVREIVAFNLIEYWDFWGFPHYAITGDTFDILDLGYWLNDGYYEPPEEDYRREALANMACDFIRIEVEPCKADDIGHLGTDVDVCPEEEAQFWGVYGRRRIDDLAQHIKDFPTRDEAEDFADMMDGLIPSWYFTVDWLEMSTEEYGPYASRFEAEQGVLNIQQQARKIGDAPSDRTYSAPYRKPTEEED